VKDIRKGDEIMTPTGKSATVLCTVKIARTKGKSIMVEFPGGLKITPKHPIRVNGIWKHPCDIG